MHSNDTCVLAAFKVGEEIEGLRQNAYALSMKVTRRNISKKRVLEQIELDDDLERLRMVLLQVSDCSSIDVDKVWGSIPRIVGLIKKQPNNPIYWSYLVDEVEKTAERIEAQLK